MAREPQARDLAVLLFAWQSRRLSESQLARAFWGGEPPAAARRGLGTLLREGWLARVAVPWLPERRLYLPTRAGNAVLERCGLLETAWVKDVPRRDREPGPAQRHDLRVVDLRLGLSESGVDGSAWVSDHQLRLQRWRPGRLERVPDGLFRFERAGRSRGGVLEYEHATYRRPQAFAMLARIRGLYPDRTLFIVTRSEARAAFFRAWVQASGLYQDAPGLAVLSWAEAVAERGLRAPWVDANGQPWDPEA